MKDNEFKARNKDTDFSKKVEADTVLGRQSAKGRAQKAARSPLLLQNIIGISRNF